MITPAQIVALNALCLDKYLNEKFKNGIDKLTKTDWVRPNGDMMTDKDAQLLIYSMKNAIRSKRPAPKARIANAIELVNNSDRSNLEKELLLNSF